MNERLYVVMERIYYVGRDEIDPSVEVQICCDSLNPMPIGEATEFIKDMKLEDGKDCEMWPPADYWLVPVEGDDFPEWIDLDGDDYYD